MPEEELEHDRKSKSRHNRESKSRRGREADASGKRFENDVATLYRLLGYEVKQNLSIAGAEDLEPIVQRGSPLDVNAVAYGLNGKLLACGGDDGIIRIYRTEDGQLLRTLEGHKASVRSVQFAPDGARLASGSTDNTVRLWDVASGQLLHVLEGNLGPVYSVCFAPSGKYLVATGAAGRLQFWDVERGETFLYLYAFGPGAWLALLPDGRLDASPEGMRYLAYTERGTLNSFTAEQLVKEFYAPEAVQGVLARYP